MRRRFQFLLIYFFVSCYIFIGFIQSARPVFSLQTHPSPSFLRIRTNRRWQDRRTSPHGHPGRRRSVPAEFMYRDPSDSGDARLDALTNFLNTKAPLTRQRKAQRSQRVGGSVATPIYAKNTRGASSNTERGYPATLITTPITRSGFIRWDFENLLHTEEGKKNYHSLK